jgi:hypothetical protein
VSATNNVPLRKYRYVAGDQMFEEVEGGKVRVTDANGKWGLFHWDGRFIEGELSTVNLHMLRYVGGPTLPKVLNFKWTELAADINRPSGWPEELEKLLPHQIGRWT